MQVLQVGPDHVARVSLSGCGRWVGVVRHGRPGQGGCDLYDRRTGRVAFTAGIRRCADAVVHPSGETLLGWGAGAGLRVVPTALPRLATVAGGGVLRAAGLAADGRRLAGLFSGGDGPWLAGWDVGADGWPRPAWAVDATDRTGLGWPHDPPAMGHYTLAVSADGGLVALATQSGGFDQPPGRAEVRYAHDGSPAAAGRVNGFHQLLAVRDDGLLVATGSPAGGDDEFWSVSLLGLLDPQRGEWRARDVSRSWTDPPAVALSPDGEHLLLPAAGGVQLLTLDPLAVRQTYTFPTAGKPTCVAFAPDGLTAACGTSKGEVVVWDVD